MQKALKIIAHVVLFLVAIIVFYLGLGIGLSANPAIGTALWVVAAVHRRSQPVSGSSADGYNGDRVGLLPITCSE